MSKHRSTHRAPRRRGRIAAVVLALGLTAAAGSAAAMGAIPQLSSPEPAMASDALAPAAIETASLEQLEIPKPRVTPKAQTLSAAPTDAPAPPAASGSGRRIVFDQSDQRVRLMDGDNSIERTYLVSGSRFNNLQPGTFAVQSRSRHAPAFDFSGTMEYFVRFATGRTAPIGFHTVPIDNAGVLEQTRAQLGTRLSAGCIRQWRPDAIALWDFAPIGTKVVVTA